MTELNLSDARKKYEELKRKDPRQASEFALTMAPLFASRQFFYRKLLENDTDLDIRRQAAISALKMAKGGAEVDYKILVKSTKILADLSEESISLRSSNHLIRTGVVGQKVAALAAFHQAKLERRWDDAYRVLAQYVKDHPNDIQRRRELGLLAYRSGLWGERAAAILGLNDFSQDKKAREAFTAVNSFFHARSVSFGSPEDAERRTKLRSPASVFQHALTSKSSTQAGNRERIVMIAPSLAGGGAERVAATICGDLSAKNKPVEMAIYEVDGKSGRDPLFYLPMTGLGRENIGVLDLKATLREPFCWLPPNLSHKSQAIHDFLKARRPHTLYLTLDMVNLSGGFAGLLAGVPNIILHCHNQRPPHVYAGLGMEGWAAAYRILLERDEIRMVAVSQTVADDYANWIDVQSSQIEIVRNGLDLHQLMKPDKPFLEAFRAELGIPRTSLVVGTAFRFEEVKRPNLWLQMAKYIVEERQNVHFVLFGEGTLLETARLRCRDFGIEDRVHFTGHVNDIYRRLPLLDVFALSSRSEGLPNVLLEAQAAGAIPVAFNVGGCQEAMIDGVTGLLVDEQSDKALGRAVLKALDDPKWRRVARKEGRKFVRSQFSVNRMLTTFNRLLNDRRTTANRSPQSLAKHGVE